VLQEGAPKVKPVVTVRTVEKFHRSSGSREKAASSYSICVKPGYDLVLIAAIVAMFNASEAPAPDTSGTVALM